ncbi:hypothetical protein Tco_0150286 [Tanacetum coccineum]
MLPEWGRFITAVKLNKGLRDSNYDQLYAYLKQHEAHANENKMMLERFTQHTVDPLALISSVAPQQSHPQSSYYSQSSTTPPSTYLQLHFADNTQLEDYDDQVIGRQGGGGMRLEESVHMIARYTDSLNQLPAVLKRNSEYFKDKMLLMQAQENGVALDEEQLLFLAGGQDNAG